MRGMHCALACAVLLSACSRVDDAQTGNSRHSWTEAGHLRVALPMEPGSLSPILATDTTEGMLARLVFDPLTEVDARGKTIPVLASVVPSVQNGGVSLDGRTITFHLRHGVRWHDGAPFTSRDVAFTYHAIMNPNNNVGTRYGFTLVDHVTTPDAYTVSFHLVRRFAPIITTLFGDSDNPYEILPAHLLEKAQSLNTLAFNGAPIGTGPFVFDRWVHGDRIEYHANPSYFRGKPQLERITARVIPNENTELNELQTHEVDWMFEPSPHTFPRLKSMPEIHYSVSDQNAYSGLLINTRRAILSESAVRHAIEASINKTAIVSRFTFGTATLAQEDLPPVSWGFAGDVQAEAYNPTHAKQLLSAAGFKPGADGVLTRNGERLSFGLSYAESSETSALISVAVQADLRAVGIDTQIHRYTGTKLFAPYGMGGVLARGNYDLNLSGWYSGTDPDNSSQFVCSARPPDGSNYTAYCNPEMEAAQQAALGSYDESTRIAAYARVEQNLARNVPQVFFYHPRNIQAYNPDLHGFAPSPIVESWNAYEWSI
jgi:peptide/nickel transport system substrate-binding protein